MNAALSTGSQFDQYRIVRLLDRGNMGEGHEVEHTTLERCYTLKLLLQEFAARAKAVAHYPREIHSEFV